MTLNSDGARVYTGAVALKSSRATTRVYEQLRSEILEGVLGPGTTLFEVEQSERIGVSRTPVREAFGRLVAEGLLDDRQGRGLVVTDVSDRDIDALFEMRTCLEAQAAQLAARHADPDVFDAYARDFRAWQTPLLDPDVTDEQINHYYVLIRRFDAQRAASAVLFSFLPIQTDALPGADAPLYGLASECAPYLLPSVTHP